MLEKPHNPDKTPEEISKLNAEILRKALHRQIEETVREAEKPSIASGLLRLVIDTIPVLGGLQKIKQARAEFRRYPLTDTSPIAEETREVARRRFAIGFFETLVDAASSGATGIIPDEILTWINRLSYFVKLKNHGQSLPWYGKVLNLVDLVDHAARLFLKIPGMKNVVDKGLKSG